MHEYVDQVISLGVFIDPRVVYALTPQEINATIEGIHAREKQLQIAENMRIGTLCASVYNCKRQKRSDKVFKWTDFFSDGQEKKPQSIEEMKSVARRMRTISEVLGDDK